MNRRELLKGAAAAAAMTTLPSFASAHSSAVLPFHFIGLGGAGRNMLETFRAKESTGQFTYIDFKAASDWPADIHFIRSPLPLENDILTPAFDPVKLTGDMHALLAEPQHYVLLTGLGGGTGTGLLQTFSQHLLQHTQHFTVIASLPFHFEQPRRSAVEQLFPSLRALPRFYPFDLSEIAAEGNNGKIPAKAFLQLADSRAYSLFLQYCR